MYIENIRKITKENTAFRDLLYTGKQAQLVVMSIPVGEEIGDEVHPHTDQLIFIVDGEGEVTIDDEAKAIEENDVIFIPAGSKHNVRNTDDEALKLFTVYAPPEHHE